MIPKEPIFDSSRFFRDFTILGKSPPCVTPNRPQNYRALFATITLILAKFQTIYIVKTCSYRVRNIHTYIHTYTHTNDKTIGGWKSTKNPPKKVHF